MAMILYGIKNCDTVKKARRHLDESGIAYRFHDFRADGLEPAWLERLEAALGWETLLNRKGTTWRQLDDAAKENLDRAKALALMLAQPSLIKRPVLESRCEAEKPRLLESRCEADCGSRVADKPRLPESAERFLIGFDPQQYAKLP